MRKHEERGEIVDLIVRNQNFTLNDVKNGCATFLDQWYYHARSYKSALLLRTVDMSHDGNVSGNLDDDMLNVVVGMINHLNVAPGGLNFRLFRNSITTGNSLIPLLQDNKIKQLHLSHNRLSAESLRILVKSAVGALGRWHRESVLLRVESQRTVRGNHPRNGTHSSVPIDPRMQGKVCFCDGRCRCPGPGLRVRMLPYVKRDAGGSSHPLHSGPGNKDMTPRVWIWPAPAARADPIPGFPSLDEALKLNQKANRDARIKTSRSTTAVLETERKGELSDDGCPDVTQKVVDYILDDASPCEAIQACEEKMREDGKLCMKFESLPKLAGACCSTSNYRAEGPGFVSANRGDRIVILAGVMETASPERIWGEQYEHYVYVKNEFAQDPASAGWFPACRLAALL